MSTKLPKELSEAYEKAISYIFHLMPISEMNFDSVIAEDVMIYGTNLDENIFAIDEFKHAIEMQAEEMEGLDISYERTPISEYYTEGGETGLGLSINNDIIKVHGGKLLIDTNSNQGSTFTVVL